MISLNKWLLLGALLCLAIACYFVGSVKGALAFIILGILLEAGFWIGLFKASKRRQ